MKRIIVTGAGGAPANNFVRSLRMADEPIHIVGIDCDKFKIHRAETDETHLVPRITEPDYLPILNSMIEETGAELLCILPDVEVSYLSGRRDEIEGRIFLPSVQTMTICQSKFASFERWMANGIKVPETIMIESEENLKECFARFGPKIWLREIEGAAGKGSLASDDYEQAKSWIDFLEGWGRFTGAECLEADSITWQSIWHEGELIVAQGRRRLYWEFSHYRASGVTGVTGAGITVADPVVDEIAERAIRAIDDRPHGILSVDLTYDRKGLPNPTEINAGRFFTTASFFPSAGLNMPYIYLKTAFGEPIELPDGNINPLEPGWVWIRGVDVEPVLVREEAIEAETRKLEERRRRLRARA